jgi:hypothetical protein
MPGTVAKPGIGLAQVMTHLKGFAQELQQNEISTDDMAIARAGGYADYGYPTFELIRGASHERATDDEGLPLFTFERNVLDNFVLNHCSDGIGTDGCIEVTAAGNQPIGTLPKPGLRTCSIGCHCHLEYSLLPEGSEGS